jgi:hypothetical protein
VWRYLFSLLGSIAWFGSFSPHTTHLDAALFSRWNESEGQRARLF